MRAVFFGTPAIAVPALRALTEVADVRAVVCQPDRPAGRGLKLQPPPVKAAAQELGLLVHQPKAVKTGELARWLKDLELDVALVMAYGRILPLDVLEAPRHGSLNLHASLLPKYRGAAPIQWAIAQGEHETGISLMQMDAGMDTGPVFCTRSLAIGPEETAGQLAERLALLAAEVTRHDLGRALSGELVATPQDEAAATYAPPIDRATAEVRWTRRAFEIANLVRAMAPRPGAHTRAGNKELKLWRVTCAPGFEFPPGHVEIVESTRALVGCGDGAIEIHRAQLAGKREASARDLINGRILKSGDTLGS